MDTKTEDFPNMSYRGLSQKDWADENGLVTSSAFQTGTVKRNDDFSEISINWNDDVNSLDNLKNATKTDSNGKEVRQFNLGYCELETSLMNRALKAHIVVGNFSYERAPIISSDGEDDNPYHGNILIKNSIKPATKRVIQGALASVAGFAHAWEDE